jgi:hypothetical protein
MYTGDAKEEIVNVLLGEVADVAAQPGCDRAQHHSASKQRYV